MLCIVPLFTSLAPTWMTLPPGLIVCVLYGHTASLNKLSVKLHFEEQRHVRVYQKIRWMSTQKFTYNPMSNLMRN